MRAMIDSVRGKPGKGWALGFAELSLGDTFMSLNEPARAEPLFRDAKAVFNDTYKGDVTWRAAGITRLGVCLLAQRKGKEAASLLEEAYPLTVRLNGPQRPYTLKVKKQMDQARALAREQQ
jgi:hypothetical protein